MTPADGHADAPPTTPGQSTPDTRAAALAMFGDQVPCFMQLVDPPCPKGALWIAFFVHEENTATCGDDVEPLPVCDDHRDAVQRANTPFWRVWFALEPMRCPRCGTPVRLDRFEALR